MTLSAHIGKPSKYLIVVSSILLAVVSIYIAYRLFFDDEIDTHDLKKSVIISGIYSAGSYAISDDGENVAIASGMANSRNVRPITQIRLGLLESADGKILECAKLNEEICADETKMHERVAVNVKHTYEFSSSQDGKFWVMPYAPKTIEEYIEQYSVLLSSVFAVDSEKLNNVREIKLSDINGNPIFQPNIIRRGRNSDLYAIYSTYRPCIYFYENVTDKTVVQNLPKFQNCGPSTNGQFQRVSPVVAISDGGRRVAILNTETTDLRSYLDILDTATGQSVAKITVSANGIGVRFIHDDILVEAYPPTYTNEEDREGWDDFPERTTLLTWYNVKANGSYEIGRSRGYKSPIMARLAIACFEAMPARELRVLNQLTEVSNDVPFTTNLRPPIFPFPRANGAFVPNEKGMALLSLTDKFCSRVT